MSTQTVDVISSKPLGELDAAAKKQRYAELRAKMGVSKLAVEGDPTKHYLWADANDTTQLLYNETLGYSIVRESNAAAVLAGKAKPKVKANWLREDGTYTNGDVILTCCDMEVYEMIMAHNSEVHEQMVAGATRDFRAEAAKLAVPTFDHIK